MDIPVPPDVPGASSSVQSVGAVISTLAINVLVGLSKPNSPLMTMVRHGLTVAAGYLVSKGLADGSQTDVIVAAGLGFTGVLLSMVRNWMTTHFMATARALPAGTTQEQLVAVVKGQI